MNNLQHFTLMDLEYLATTNTSQVLTLYTLWAVDETGEVLLKVAQSEIEPANLNLTAMCSNSE